MNKVHLQRLQLKKSKKKLKSYKEKIEPKKRKTWKQNFIESFIKKKSTKMLALEIQERDKIKRSH